MESRQVWEESRQAQLINISNFNGQLTVSSREVANNFNKRSSDVLEKIDNLINEIGSTENSVQYFIPSFYNDASGKKNREYEMTRDGLTLLAMGFTGTKALEWKLKYIDAFNEMEKQLVQQMPKVSKEIQAILQLDNRTIELDNRIEKLENTMTIDYGQQEHLNSIAKARVVDALGGYDCPAYKKFKNRLFSMIWRNFQRTFHVNTYKNTPVVLYDKALYYVEHWEPTEEMQYAIIGANSQIKIE